MTKDKAKKVDATEILITCSECNYKCKKKTTMDKHMLMRHDEYVCKECPQKLLSFIELAISNVPTSWV